MQKKTTKNTTIQIVLFWKRIDHKVVALNIALQNECLPPLLKRDRFVGGGRDIGSQFIINEQINTIFQDRLTYFEVWSRRARDQSSPHLRVSYKNNCLTKNYNLIGLFYKIERKEEKKSATKTRSNHRKFVDIKIATDASFARVNTRKITLPIYRAHVYLIIYKHTEKCSPTHNFTRIKYKRAIKVHHYVQLLFSRAIVKIKLYVHWLIICQYKYIIW